MNDDDMFDKWLKQANNDLIDSISGSIDVEDELATVKYRAATGPDRASPDHLAAEFPGRVRERLFALSVVRTATRPRKAVSAAWGVVTELARSRGIFAVLGATVATGVFVLFALLPGNHSPLFSLPVFTDRAANIGPEDTASDEAERDSLDDERQPGQDHFRLPPALPSAGAAPGAPAPGTAVPGGKTPEAPGSWAPGSRPPASEPPEPGRPAPAEPAPGAPGAPEAPPSQSPAVQSEKTVELSTAAGSESVRIDTWTRADTEPDDLYRDHGGIYTALDATLSLVDPSVNATYQHCAQNTAWITRVEFVALQEGSRLCARSSTGRYAVLTIVALPGASGDRLVLHGKTWQLADPPPSEPPTPRTPPVEPPPTQPTPPPPPPG